MTSDEGEPDDGFDRFMAERWPGLVRSAYLLTGDRYDAEDLAQTALTKVFASWNRVRRVDNADAYLQRVLVNCNLTRFRKRRVAEYPVSAMPERTHPVRDADGVLEERSAFMAALADLGPQQRAVIVLRYYEDLTEAQTAEVMGCSVGTVKSQNAKALARLHRHGELAAYIPMLIEEGVA